MGQLPVLDWFKLWLKLGLLVVPVVGLCRCFGVSGSLV